MGRKAAPQPLALSSQTSPQAQAQAQTQSESGAALRSRDDSRTAETVSPAPVPIPVQRPSTATASTEWSREESVPRQPLRHTREDPSTYPSISSTLEEHLPDPPATTAATTQSEAVQLISSDSKKGAKNGFFHFNKQSKSSNQSQPHAHHRKHTETRAQVMSRGSDGSNRPRHGDKHDPSPSASYTDHTLHKPVSADPLRSDLSLSSAGDYDTASPQSSTKKGRSKPFGLLNRSRSNRDKEDASPELKPASSPRQGNEPELHLNSVPYKTANQGGDRSIRDMMNSAVRNRSEDRAPRDSSSTRRAQRDKESKTQPSSLNENGGSFFNGLKSSGTRAAGMLSDRFFNKSGRGGREDKDALDDEHYQIKVINLPLVEQTRLTRISKRLEDSRDKTEFWMPAFPWRAIDYLNYKGCEVEGLYRVPGSGPQIKKWQRKFDEQYDVNLFNERDLYDINIIGSMLKAWLRELPDELFPKAAQDRIARECAGAEEVPELLIEELSNLSPFNYYLLFAITCHLSLLLAHSDKNKMDFRNLCICFQPCMKIDAFCFKFLVCDWRDCWRGCKNEAKYIEEEYMIFDQPPPRGLAEPAKPRPQDESEDDRQQLSSSGSSKQSGRLSPSDQKPKLKKKQLQISPSNGSVVSNESTAPTTLTINSDRELGRTSSELRPLSPIMPLSPLGF
ncbi:Putative Rho-type GTPase-activating protein 2 [Fusarium odoratissimum]|uniref:Putative Rho-type GTPase-activating protein 2 n=1 Tax=Fusarium oxysporum f. sp. cubense (strain race 4) TaxID=2502994 RepID=N1RM92_FUSC4|nr:Putative Rho-type GTPase-activating protein 2 [Fusarium odoratissimum]